MRYEDAKLIRDYVRLGLQIAAAKNPETKHEISERDTLQRGYALVRARMVSLGPKKRAAFRAMLADEIRGVREVIAKAKASGEAFTLADIEIEMSDLETGQAIPDRPNVQQLEEANSGEPEQVTEQEQPT